MDGLLCEGKQLILSRFYLMPWKTYYLLFQKAAPFRQDWSKEPALSCLRHRGNSTRILHHRSGFIIIMLPPGAVGSSRRSQPCGGLKWTTRKSLKMRYGQSCPIKNAPSVFPPDQIMRIIGLACSSPNDFGYEVSQWSLPLLVAEIKKQGIAEQISEKSVSRFLKMR